MFMRWRELEAEQKKPLDYKMEMAGKAIVAAFSSSRNRVALAFSAGKDSTALADFIRRFHPDLWERLHIIYGDTGVEYPECVKFWRFICHEWNLGDRAHVARPERTDEPGLKYESQRKVWQWAIETGKIKEVLKPDGKLKTTRALESLAEQMEGGSTLPRWPTGTRKGYWWCVDQYGWPLLGKAFSKLKAHRINIDTFLRFSKSQSTSPKLLAYYRILKQVKISQACCDFLKKEPSRRIQQQLGVDVILKGLMASESRSRAKNFLSRGYLFQGARVDYLRDDPFWHCQPLAIWTDDDIWQYLRRYDVPYAALYDLGYRDKSGNYHKIKRNGCMGCATDLLFPNNHMAMLRRTHPRSWFTFMSLGMAAQIQTLQRINRNGQMSIFDTFEPEELLEAKPCYFDSITHMVMCDDTGSGEQVEFDPEVED